MAVSARTGRRILLLVLAFLGLLIVTLLSVVRSNVFRDWLQAEISARSGYTVRAGALSYRLPFGIVAAAVQLSKAPQFELTTERLSVSFNPFDLGSSTLGRLEFEKPELQLDIDEMMKAPRSDPAQIGLRHLNIRDGTIVVRKGRKTLFQLPNITLSAENLNLGGQSGVNLRADVPQFHGEAELAIKGQLRDLDSQLIVRPKQSKGIFSRRTTERAELLNLRLKLRAPAEQPAEAMIESKFDNLAVGAYKLTGTLNTQVAIDANVTEASISGATTIADFPHSVSPVALQLAKGNASAKFTANYSIANKTLRVKEFSLHSHLGKGSGAGEITFTPPTPSVNAKITLRELPVEALKSHLPAPMHHWNYQGHGQLELDLQGAWNALVTKGTIQSDKLQMRGDDVVIASATVAAPFEWTNPTLRFKETKIRAEKLTYTPKDRWQAAAEKLQIDATFDYQAKQPLIKLNGRVETTGAKFNSPDSTKIGENLNLRGPLQLMVDSEKQITTVSGKISADNGEILWGKFFGDVKLQKPVVDLEVDYVRNRDRLDCRRCRVNFATIGAVEASGAIERLMENPEFRLRAQSASFSPNGFFEFFLRETFKRQYPVLDRLNLAGQMAFQLELQGSLDTLNAEGELSLKGAELTAKSNDWRIGPFALELPFQVNLAQAKAKSSGNPRIGTLTIERARFAKQTIPRVSTSLSLANNSLRLHQPIRMAVFGGTVEIGNLFWPDIINDPRKVSFSAETKRLQLQELTEAMDWPRFSGTMTGSIPEVQSIGTTLRTGGEIQAEVFGGRVRMGRLEIENPFSALASIKLDAKLDNIQLEQLSKTFAFGRISGILEGTIDELVLTDGQPAELRADLHSVDRGGEQRISVEALNKITVLSSGQEAGALYGGLASFFDSFRYSKLGFKATLKNDRLTLRGVESQGDKEMLVVGSLLPPTVNIVSHTQNIAFSELLRRLERIKSDKPNVK